MPPAPPQPEAVARAWELRAQGYPYRHVAELLRGEGYKCASQETARTWANLGAAAERYVEVLDRTEGRYLLADGLDQDMAMLRELVRNGMAGVLDVMPHLKWLYRERARLIGTDAAPQPATLLLEDGREDPEVPKEIVEAVRKTMRAADAETRALRNGEVT